MFFTRLYPDLLNRHLFSRTSSLLVVLALPDKYVSKSRVKDGFLTLTHISRHFVQRKWGALVSRRRLLVSSPEMQLRMKSLA